MASRLSPKVSMKCKVALSMSKVGVLVKLWGEWSFGEADMNIFGVNKSVRILTVSTLATKRIRKPSAASDN